MREIELKAVLDSWTECRGRLERAGATRVFTGRLEDRRYDGADGSFAARDIVLRLRSYYDESGVRAELDYKGPTAYDQGYKVREEIGSGIDDPDAFAEILAGLGYHVTRRIDREIEQFALGGAVIRFERYPRMDDLVEVEGDPDAIERAIAAMGIARTAFNSDRLTDYVTRYEARTGERAAVSRAELPAAAPARAED
jgi:predicted adenylyl cyclase CyaB